jgi:hypothetical protein
MPKAIVRPLTCIAAAALLASCGGGGNETAATVTAPASTAAAVPSKRIQSFRAARHDPDGCQCQGNVVAGLHLAADLGALGAAADGRVMTYGSDLNGLQTGHANYDVWDSNGAPDAKATDAGQHHRHRHLLQLAVAAAADGNVFIAGGDVWNGRRPPTARTTTATSTTARARR